MSSTHDWPSLFAVSDSLFSALNSLQFQQQGGFYREFANGRVFQKKTALLKSTRFQVVTGTIPKMSGELGCWWRLIRELVDLHGKHVKKPISPATKKDRIKMQTAISNGMKFTLHKVAAL